MVAIALTLLLAVLPPRPASASPPFGAIYGTANDDITAGPLPGIKVEAFAVSGSTYTPSLITYTNAGGNYAMAVPSGITYRVVFTDPSANPNQVYADSVFLSWSYIEMGTDIHVTNGAWSSAWASMTRASRIRVSLKRAGQWATPLQGVTVSILEVPEAATRAYTTGSDGSVVRGGIPAGHYRVTASDPAGMFSTVVTPTAPQTHSLATNDEWIVEGQMSLLHSSADIAVSKPSSKSSIKHGNKLSVSGTLSKKITSPKSMRLDAYQYSPSAMAWVLNKNATLKIKKSGSKSAYSGSIKFPWAGKWRLVAVFTGNNKYVQSGSTYKDVKVN